MRSTLLLCPTELQPRAQPCPDPLGKPHGQEGSLSPGAPSAKPLDPACCDAVVLKLSESQHAGSIRRDERFSQHSLQALCYSKYFTYMKDSYPPSPKQPHVMAM